MLMSMSSPAAALPTHTYFSIPHDPGNTVAGIEDVDSHLGPGGVDLALHRGARFPLDLFRGQVFKPRKKQGNQYWDFLFSIDDLLVASRRARDFLSAQGLTDEDFQSLPIAVQDKKGNLRPEDYAIVNPLKRVACLDSQRADCELKSYSDGTQRWLISVLQVDADKIPPDLRLFRLEEDPGWKIIRGDLLQALKAAGLKGLAGLPMGENPLSYPAEWP